MGQSIVQIQMMGDALRSSGYKDIGSAVSEIIDNSFEANAKNVFIILSETVSTSGWKYVTEFGFLDDGDGMDDNTLGFCLGIGATTRSSRKGMGRFGVGLPQASLYATPHVEVYSWQGDIRNAKKVILDIDDVKRGIQTEIEDPVEEAIPEKYQQYIHYRTPDGKEYDFSKHGTLVLWKSCDNVQPKTQTALLNRLQPVLGRKFRYFITQSDVTLKLIPDSNQGGSKTVHPNDPLFLLENNMALGKYDDPKHLFSFEDEEAVPIFEPFELDGLEDGMKEYPVKYYDSNGIVKESSVLVTYSVVKKEFYDSTAIPMGSNPGDYPIGKFAKALDRISIIRANREIDFGKFDFFSDTNSPYHRWWGCEIRFDPELDELFGVANNKQQVELRKFADEDIDSTEEVQPIWYQLREVEQIIKKMVSRNSQIRQGTRTPAGGEPPSSPSENTVDTVEGRDQKEPPKTPDEKDIEAGRKGLEDLGEDNPSEEEILHFLSKHIHIKYHALGTRGPSFDYKFPASTAVLLINTDHQFYRLFLEKIISNDADAKSTFELFLAAFVKAIDATNWKQETANDALVRTWEEKLSKYIGEQINPS